MFAKVSFYWVHRYTIVDEKFFWDDAERPEFSGTNGDYYTYFPTSYTQKSTNYGPLLLSDDETAIDVTEHTLSYNEL